MTRYSTGRTFEYKVRSLLEESGWWVVRSAGSKGVADLVGVSEAEVILVQCKHGAQPFSTREWNELYRTASAVGATPILARSTAERGRAGVEWWQLGSEKEGRTGKKWRWSVPKVVRAGTSGTEGQDLPRSA